jgi:hypothetical protein
MANPSHRGLNFKRLKPHSAFSVRIGLRYRAICFQVDTDTYMWEWIGSHSDYDKMVDQL